jgi:hypothetical protein
MSRTASFLFPWLVIAAVAGCRSDEARPAALPRALSAGAQPSAPMSFGTSASDPAFAEQSYAATAYGGGVFLTAWTALDFQRMYVARTRASDGVLLDERRIPITTDTFAAPVVGSDGQGFLVVWSARGVRVSADGTVVDKTPLVLPTNPTAAGGQWAVSYGGGYYLVLWQEEVDPSNHQRDIRAIRVRPGDGAVVPPVISVPAHASPESFPAAAFDGTNFLVVWQDQRSGTPVYGNRIRASDGALLDGADGFRIGTSATGQRPAVAFGSGIYLVAWQATPSLLVGVRIRPADRAALDATDLPLVPVSTGSVDIPRLTHDGTHFVMAWRNIGLDDVWRFRAVRIDPATGANLDGAGQVFGASPAHTADRVAHGIAAGAGKTFAVFNQGDTGAQNLHAAEVRAVKGVFLDPATGGIAQPASVVSRSAHWQEEPHGSFDGQRHLLVWHEWTGTRFEIRGARVSNDSATVLDPDGFTVSGAGTADQLFPRSASNGSNHLVVWWDGTSLRARRIKGDGTQLDGAGVVLPAKPDRYGSDSPRWDVATDGADYLVLWLEGAFDPVLVRAARIRGSDGAVLDASPIAVAPPGKNRLYAKLAFGGPHYVAMWIQGRPAPAMPTIEAVRVASGGSVLDATPLVISTGGAQYPAIAADGQNALLAWADSGGLKARRLRVSDGTVLDSSDLVLANQLVSSSLAFDGENFVFVWPAVIPPGMSGWAAHRVSKSGTVLAPAIPITSIPSFQFASAPALSAGAGGKLLVGYTLYDDSADFQTERLRARLLGDPVAVPDAAVPPSPDAAPDQAPPADLAATVDSGAPVEDAAAPDAGVPDSSGSGPEVAENADLAPPVDDSARAADGPAVDGMAAPEDGGQDLGALAGDAGPVPGDVGSGDRPASEADASSGDASLADVASPSADAAHDASAERPGSGTSCDCRLAGRPRSGGFAFAFVTLALIARLRRRRWVA